MKLGPMSSDPISFFFSLRSLITLSPIKGGSGFRFERDSTRGALVGVCVYMCVLEGGGVKPVLYCQKWSSQ